jgi:GTPase SAR1 family protein
MVMYDVTNVKSFQNVNNWVSQIKEGASGNPVVYLLGNKVDDVDGKKVKYEEGDELANKLGIKFFETSAKEDKNVTESFENMAEDVYKTFGDVTESQQTQKVFKSTTGEDNKVKKKCC